MSAASGFSADLASLNAECACLPLDRETIAASILSQPGRDTLAAPLERMPHAFAGTPVFLATSDLGDMIEQIGAIEAAAALPAFEALVRARMGDGGAGLDPQPGTRGLLMGYDFHITPEGPKLIEINTNAGGAFLVDAMQADMAGLKVAAGCFVGAGAGLSDGFTARAVEMVLSEWRAAGRPGAPTRLAIVDAAPEGQYLYPDMVLARALFETAGIEVRIVDPSALKFTARGLELAGLPVDMVYNRLTDFDLSAPAHAELRALWQADAVVLSPSPRHHALYADKRNLTVLSHPSHDVLEELSCAQRDALGRIPETVTVTPDRAEALWAGRKQYFFKPANGFGSRAAYRGAKLTRRVWTDILAGDYVAQRLVPPPVRCVTMAAGPATLKYDLRVYAYAGSPMLLAARMYEGQTTNFRTRGGGFAPVILSQASNTQVEEGL